MLHGENVNDPYYNPDARPNRLWDNQYVYDQIIEAAMETGVEIITNLDLEENSEYRNISLGDMEIEILNYERDRMKKETLSLYQVRTIIV